MEGRIARFSKGFGFIKPKEGGDEVFVHRSSVQNGTPAEGDEVSFEIEQGAKGPRAKDVRIIKRNPNPPPPSTHVPPPKAAHAQPQGLAVAFSYNKLAGGKLLVKVRLTRGNVPVTDKAVTLLWNGKKPKGLKPVHPVSDGTASFLIDDPGHTVVFHALVDGNLYSDIQGKSQEDLKPKLEAKLVRVDRNGVHTFQVTSVPNTEVTVNSQVPAEFRKAGTQWGVQMVSTEPDGTLTLELKVTESGARGDVFILAAGLRSQPFWVVNNQPKEKHDG